MAPPLEVQDTVTSLFTTIGAFNWTVGQEPLGLNLVLTGPNDVAATVPPFIHIAWIFIQYWVFAFKDAKVAWFITKLFWADPATNWVNPASVYKDTFQTELLTPAVHLLKRNSSL